MICPIPHGANRGTDRPVQVIAAERIRTLVTQLDDPVFAQREAALKTLLELGEAALPELRQQLEHLISVEQKARIEKLIEQLASDQPMSVPKRRATRSIMLLERLGTKEARKFLDELATGLPQATLTREAIAASARLRAKDQ